MKTKNPDNIVLKWKIVQKRKKQLITLISYTSRMPQWMHPTAKLETRLSMKQSKCPETQNLE